MTSVSACHIMLTLTKPVGSDGHGAGIKPRISSPQQVTTPCLTWMVNLIVYRLHNRSTYDWLQCSIGQIYTLVPHSNGREAQIDIIGDFAYNLARDHRWRMVTCVLPTINNDHNLLCKWFSKLSTHNSFAASRHLGLKKTGCGSVGQRSNK